MATDIGEIAVAGAIGVKSRVHVPARGIDGGGIVTRHVEPERHHAILFLSLIRSRERCNEPPRS